MLYIVVGVVGFLAVVGGIALGVGGSPAGGWIVGGTGGALTAVGVIGFGVQQRRDRASASRRLAEEEAAERLAERRAREERERADAEDRRRVDELRLARLRDIDRIRRAMLAELRRLEPGVAIEFKWGRTPETLEVRSYAAFPEQGLFYVLMEHGGRHAAYGWPAGGMPRPIGADHLPEGDVESPDDVERAYALFQPERYLVREHLGPDDQLELPEPGYYRHGRPPESP